MKNLWDISHDYHCEPTNYFSGDTVTRFDSWRDFVLEWGGADLDYNMLFRWDWDPGQLVLHFMLQRKGIYQSCIVSVSKDDQDGVREYLRPRREYMMRLWDLGEGE